jgi:hypothetical protein
VKASQEMGGSGCCFMLFFFIQKTENPGSLRIQIGHDAIFDVSTTIKIQVLIF